jgi:DNA-binding IclR family transcriptional regulator
LPENAETPTQGVAAVDRALSILSAFEENPEPLTLAALSKKTGLYKSTLLRLIASLQAYGYITRNPDGRYFLGPTLLRLGAAYQRASSLHDRVMPVLRELVAQGTESPSFHVRHDAKQRLCLFRLDSHHSTLDAVSAGMLLPLDRGAAGKVILAFSGQQGKEFDRIRERFIAVSYGERDPHCAGLACPVFGADGNLIGALSVSGPRERFDDKNVARMAELVMEAAVRLTRDFGGQPQAMLKAREILRGSFDSPKRKRAS